VVLWNHANKAAEPSSMFDAQGQDLLPTKVEADYAAPCWQMTAWSFEHICNHRAFEGKPRPDTHRAGVVGRIPDPHDQAAAVLGNRDRGNRKRRTAKFQERRTFRKDASRRRP